MIAHWRLAAGVVASWVAGWASATTPPAPSPKIDNSVAACVRVDARSPIVQSNLVLLPATLTVKRSVAACGCKAAALTYRVTDRQGRQVTQGDIWSVARDQARGALDFTFVLSADASIGVKAPLRLALSCAAPD